MQAYVNTTGVPLSVAVYLATDHYDRVPNAISATSLLKSVRQNILTKRVPAAQAQTEITTVVKSRLGTSIHDGLEKAWIGGHYKKAMANLGYPQSIIDRIVVNPGYETGPNGQLVKMANPPILAKDAIPVYMEIRSFGEIEGVRISGKFDFVAEGRVEDFKSTSTFTWTNETKTEDYRNQGSIYRWLNQDIITQDTMAIQFFFTDWQRGRSLSDKSYPKRQVEQLLIPLMTIPETENFIRGRIQEFQRYKDSPEVDLPPCNDKELWRKAPTYKYYKNPASAAAGSRSTKNFETLLEAHSRLVEDGNVGVVVEVPGEVVACKYCAAFPVCTQKDALIADGSLNFD